MSLPGARFANVFSYNLAVATRPRSLRPGSWLQIRSAVEYQLVHGILIDNHHGVSFEDAEIIQVFSRMLNAKIANEWEPKAATKTNSALN